MEYVSPSCTWCMCHISQPQHNQIPDCPQLPLDSPVKQFRTEIWGLFERDSTTPLQHSLTVSSTAPVSI